MIELFDLHKQLSQLAERTAARRFPGAQLVCGHGENGRPDRLDNCFPTCNAFRRICRSEASSSALSSFGLKQMRLDLGRNAKSRDSVSCASSASGFGIAQLLIRTLGDLRSRLIFKCNNVSFDLLLNEIHGLGLDLGQKQSPVGGGGIRPIR
jgi:hypothetical protein